MICVVSEKLSVWLCVIMRKYVLGGVVLMMVFGVLVGFGCMFGGYLFGNSLLCVLIYCMMYGSVLSNVMSVWLMCFVLNSMMCIGVGVLVVWLCWLVFCVNGGFDGCVLLYVLL